MTEEPTCDLCDKDEYHPVLFDQSKNKYVCDLCAKEACDTEYTDDLFCPWCGHKDAEPWELSEDDGVYHCSECDQLVEYCRNVSITYTTRRSEEEP